MQGPLVPNKQVTQARLNNEFMITNDDLFKGLKLVDFDRSL